MTLDQYTRASKLYNEKNDQIEQIAWCICVVFNKRPEDVNNWGKWKFLFYTKWLNYRFSKVIKPLRPLDMITDAEQITLGQFIEVEHFMKSGPYDSLAPIGATIWKKEGNHKDKAKELNKTNVRRQLPQITKFIESFQKLIESYSGLFEQEAITTEEMEPTEPHPFVTQYGWIYSAKQVGDFEGIPLDKAYDLHILQAFNDLAYLKAFSQYQKDMK